MIIVLDSTPLGLFLQRRDYRESGKCQDWMEAHLAKGNRIVVPEIIHYEIRRELLRLNKGAALDRLEKFVHIKGVEFLQLNSEALRQAAELWADVRRDGKPTADRHALDIDAILAAQALTAGFARNGFVVATSNVAHLSRFVPAEVWSKI